MSSVYNLEPNPEAKVILKSTSGDLELSLWVKQTPLAARNFLQHCIDGYYNGTTFHRLVPGFVIQGGDPTGTGRGGISAINDGAGFEAEVHSRLKFNRRGLLGMAKDEDGICGSQFFITLGATPELQGKHTLFGRVEGDTMYNLMKMGESELVEGEGSERPAYPTEILGAEVLVNPFKDMVARVKEVPRARDGATKIVAKKRKKPAGNNVLSFGGEEGEDVAPVVKKFKANPKFLPAAQEEPTNMNITHLEEAERSPQMKSGEFRVGQEIAESKFPVESAVHVPIRKEDDEDEDESGDDESRLQHKRQSQLEKTNAEIAALKASMRRTIGSVPREGERPKNALEEMIPATSTRGRRRGKMQVEKGALDQFKAFKERLGGLPADKSSPPSTNSHKGYHSNERVSGELAEDDEEDDLCDLHFIVNCLSCKAWNDDKPEEIVDVDAGDDSSWMSHTLICAKDKLGKDLEWKKKMAEVEVIDPIEKARIIKEERRKEKVHIEQERGQGQGRVDLRSKQVAE